MYDSTVGDLRKAGFPAKSSLEELINNTVVTSSLIKSSLSPAQKLYESLNSALENAKSKNEGDSILWTDYFALYSAYNTFYSTFCAELEMANAYLVTNKGAYDPTKLISEGEALFSPDLISKVPNALNDVKEIGRSLAFEMGTACGFHTMRMMESVLQRYWDTVTDGADRPKHPNLGVYIRELSKIDHDTETVTSTLQIIKDHHRNPLIHPQHYLSVEQARALVAIADSAITYMLKSIDVAASIALVTSVEELV